MAKGHKKVARRSLTPEEWARLRLNEAAAWREVAAKPTTGWQIRPAAYRAPGDYRFLGPWRRIEEGELFGAPDGTFFFRARVRVPAAMDGLPVVLEHRSPTESLVRLGGELVDGFDPNRSRVPLADPARAGQRFAVELETTMRSPPDDMRVTSGPGWGCTQVFRHPRLVVPDRAVEQFLYDAEIALEAAVCLQVDETAREFLLHHLDQALQLLDRDAADRAQFHRGIARARRYLERTVYADHGLSGPGALALVAHSHVDVAYHWRPRQGIRKNARTAAVQLALMEAYPELVYCHSQPFLYETLKAHYPRLFERVKRKVAEGRWELVGATYVEPDCNVPSPESLVRQCLYGQLFLLREFGRTVDTCWLPDVFGNSWAMPQILARAGVRFFVSNKMSTWNDTNVFPHTNFIWRGVDGTEVFAAVPPSHFNSWLAPEQLLESWAGFQEKVEVGESMHMFGFGDGGGGVTRELLETVRRIPAFPGLPRTRLVKARDYLEEAFAEPQELAVWDDELYLEMHRGTYTTKGALKRLNRRCELAAREAELWSVLAAPYGFQPPRQKLAAAWKQTLVNQFHDILPGSHTSPVGQEAEETTAEAHRAFGETMDAAVDHIARAIGTEAAESDWAAVHVFNSLTWPVTGLVTAMPAEEGPCRVVDAEGREIPSQARQHGDSTVVEFIARDVPPCGYATYFLQRGKRQAATHAALRASPRVLESRLFRIRLNRNGEIVRLLDKRCGRQVVPEGQRANRFRLFEDKPGNYDAWDIVRSYEDKHWDLGPAVRAEVVATGPVRAGVRFERSFFDSRLAQTLWVYEGIPRIDFETEVEWRERNRLLKVAFPADVLARRASYDLGYGSIARPTHRNTSWDEAKFEVCGHKWADLSEAAYGLSVLNDSKYGWDVRGNVIRLSLLRGPIRPDPDSDLGKHAFTYALFPHQGTWQQGGTVRAAYELNCPLTTARARPAGDEGPLPPCHSFLGLDGPNAHVGALKPAEDGDGAVLRLVEQHGARGPVRVSFDRPLASVEECDLLERPERALEAQGEGFTAVLRPFEIRSFRIRL
ncbi:MAG: alpha-mannosidase [Candidatus Brocadiia bacterium]